MATYTPPTTTNEINGNGVVQGTAQNDQINLGNANNTVYAGAGDDVVYGGTGNNVIFGQDGNDYLYAAGGGTDQFYGGAGDDVMYGASGNDLFVGGTGNNVIFGGGGVNTAVFGELREQATVTRDNSGNTIVTGPEGTDTMQQITVMRFLDGTVTTDTGSTVAQAYRLYNAAFGRVPDASGLGYWTAALDGGGDLDTIAAGFLSTPEYAAYGSLTNSQYVTELYRNVLGRAPDGAGQAYWQGQLDQSTLTRAQVLAGFSESAENVGGTQPTIAAGIFAPSQAALQVLATYQTVLGHAPDRYGLAYWIGQVQAGTGLAQLAAQILASPEYQARAASGNSAFVAATIRNATGGTDAAGAAYWTDQLNGGASTMAGVAATYAATAQAQAQIAPLLTNGFQG